MPSDQRVDLVFKTGHYKFQYIAIRFDRRSSSHAVDVTYFSYGSALDFWKEFEKTEDSVSFKRGTLSKTEFDQLMAEAVTYADSKIEEIPVIRKIRRKDGTWYYSGSGGASMTMSSGDGSILFGLSNPKNGERLISDPGSLVGDLTVRKENGYDFLRPNLIWKVFTDPLETKIDFVPLRPNEAEESAIERLQETPLSNDYNDYYRQALFVQILARVGSDHSIPVLKKISSSNGLEPNWNKYLSDESLWAIEQITTRTKHIISSIGYDHC